MGRLEKLKTDFSRALKRLEEAVERAKAEVTSPDYPFFRDSAVQRFEFTFELMWKLIKAFLEGEGITCRSPKGCIRELFSAGFIDEELARALLKMVKDRNLTVHTYREEGAEELFGRLPNHVGALKRLNQVIE